MRLSYVVLAVLAIGCGGGGGDAGPTSNNGNNPGGGTGTPPGGGTGASGSAAVAMRQTDDGYGSAVFSFSPTSVTLTRNGTVTWSNEGGTTAHNVTFAAATGVPANVANMTSGTATRTFATAGTFSYQCTNHAGMSGQVIVQ